MTQVTKESLSARIAELESGTRSIKEDYQLEAYRMLLPLIESTNSIYQFDMGEASKAFFLLKDKHISTNVKDEDLGEIGATRIEIWTSKTGGKLSYVNGNGGATLTIYPQGFPKLPSDHYENMPFVEVLTPLGDIRAIPKPCIQQVTRNRGDNLATMKCILSGNNEFTFSSVIPYDAVIKKLGIDISPAFYDENGLLPCPFCGEKAEVRDERLRFMVRCKNRECGATLIGDRTHELGSEDDAREIDWEALEKTAVDKWNNRN